MCVQSSESSVLYSLVCLAADRSESVDGSAGLIGLPQLTGL